MEDTVVLKFRDENSEESFTLSRSKLVDHSDYFKAYFERWVDQVGRKHELVYDDRPPGAFRMIYLFVLLELDFGFRDISLPDLDDSLQLADFFLFHRYARRIKQILTDCWQEAEDAIAVLKYARTKYPDEPRLTSRCVWQAVSIVQDRVHYPLEKSYDIVAYAAADLKKMYMYCRDTFDTTAVIKNVLIWLVRSPFSRHQIKHLLSHLDLEVFPSEFVRECLASIRVTGNEEKRSKKWVADGARSVYANIRRGVNEMLRCLYIFDNLSVCKFDTLLWAWENDEVLLDSARLFASHKIDQIIYLFFDRFFSMVDLNTMGIQDVLLSRHDEYGQLRHTMWTSYREILSCHDERCIYFVPNLRFMPGLPSEECGLQFDMNAKEFSRFPVQFAADTARAVPVCHGGYLYTAGMDAGGTSIEVHRYGTADRTYRTLCRKNIEGVSSPNYIVCSRMCLGVLHDELYVFCFGYNVYFSVALKGTLCESDLVMLENEHFEKMTVQRAPHISACSDAFVILLEIISEDLETDFVVCTVRPKESVLKILGYLPRNGVNNFEIVSLVSA